jgi:hypothetical protein
MRNTYLLTATERGLVSWCEGQGGVRHSVGIQGVQFMDERGT